MSRIWNRIANKIQSFPSAVLTFVEKNGFPFSMRCNLRYDRNQQVFRLYIYHRVGIQPGPANLLCHQHDKNLWNLKSIVLRGRVEEDEQGWLFRPSKFILGMGGFFGYVRFVVQGRRLARKYLDRRGLKRPRVPWSEYVALVNMAKRDESQIE